MANTRLSMRKIKDVLRLTHDVHLNTRQVALSLNISRSTVKNYQERAQKAGLSWPLPEDLTEEPLEQKLFPPLVSVEAPAKALPDFDYIYRELKAHKKFNLTLDQLWREYREQHPDGYQYSQFCQLYRDYRSKLDYSMRQDHKGGEKLFVDYGEGLSLIDPQSSDPHHNPAFCRGLGCLDLHLRRSHSHSTTARLDRLPYPSLRLLWLRPQDRGARLSEECRQPRLPLRARDKPDLRRHGPPLRHLRYTGPARSSPGQGQGRKRRTDRQALDPLGLAPPHISTLWPISIRPLVNCSNV